MVVLLRRDGKKQETPGEQPAKPAWQIHAGPNKEKTVSSKAEDKDQHPRLSSELYTYSHITHIVHIIQTHTHIHIQPYMHT